MEKEILLYCHLDGLLVNLISVKFISDLYIAATTSDKKQNTCHISIIKFLNTGNWLKCELCSQIKKNCKTILAIFEKSENVECLSTIHDGELCFTY